ncbi:TPA: C39 family peptidase [Streptococcus pyogenes]|uniref:C39 family peptidase n=1 Tax=Streptococcus pyogenes TaxID=1314 RepID=UPI000057BE90|nr:C39 family peptidase [Streptococcus pyogenes]EQL82328.1 LPXTG cell wall anchor domain protein [Streptococcus pyogenes UTSW-2]ESA58201.1 LPXTG cell wall anchor domain protein [Streptococcus pyogenes GA40377]HER4562270.1 C39 family peptidase [Streptococcus pyogenes NGAS671]HER4570752.1 C39 family peptidase [Streptococcus pyogenes NGAS653]HER4724559.1 C39 family peptidase [Streptococcus pyogenes NGAS302]HER4731248.1 C39 family peptidase [Streptococcus pyogenes NGAS304]HER4771042.1 C39 family
MKQTKVLTGIAVAALSTGTGLVQADDLSNTRPAKAAEVVTHTEVTENQVADAKTKADEATKAVKDQEATVKAIEAEKSQAQQSLVEATTAVNDTEKLASEATPDGLTKAQEETEASQSAVTDAQAQLEAAQEAESKAQTAVDHQKETVAKASQAVNQAKAALTTSNQAADVSAAEEKVLEAQEAVTKAETQVSQAQEADAKHESDVRHAKEELDLKSQKLTEKQTTLEQVMAAIEAERLTKPVENGTYFNQRDNEWQKAYGGKTFAATGCVPSALAMVFSELAKREVTPTEIADYLWHNTDEFNKHYGGTSGKGLVAATNHYGFASTHLDSQSTIIAALQAGHHVLAAVQNNKFSPWGSQYSHEIVLRGYSNGNTYVYDPYNRANIGWYPIANLWNEQSRDAIDTAEVGVPFFKITTQKMAQLEMAKAVANEGLDEAKQAVKQAEANVTALEQVISQTSQAKEQLAAAKANLVTAKDMLDKAKQTAKLTEQDLETKTANLKQAQEHLTLKQDDLAKAQTELAAQEKSLEQLTQVLSLAQENLGRATKAVEQTKADLTQKQAYVTNLKQVTKLRQESQAKVNQAKAVLSEASARLEQELETLKTLQAKEANLTAQYQAIFKAYQAVLAVKHHSQLAESKAKLEAKGEEAVPVVNEVGHVTDYVSGPTQLADAVAVRTEETSSKTKNTSPVSVKLMAKQGHQKALETIVTSQSSLPQTGEQVVSILSLVGLNFLGLSSFLGLRKQEEK